MDFNVTEYQEVIDMVTDSTLHAKLRKLPLIEFQCDIKEDYSQLPEKATEIFFFP